MPLIDFFLSNDRHHVAMFLPIVQCLAALPDYRCRVISLCEFRGLRSPAEKFAMADVEFRQVIPRPFRSPSSGAQLPVAGRAGFMRRFAQDLSWTLLLRQRIGSHLDNCPDLAVVPNDAAFPYDRIAQGLKAKQIPFLLMQEGVRFPLPAASPRETYGANGARAIAAWGETSAEYFRRQGVAEPRIRLTGNPRFDSISATDWRAAVERLQSSWRLGGTNLLLLSNPIDDQGFCTPDAKLALLERFFADIEALFATPDFCLVVKLHARESVSDVSALIRQHPYGHRIRLLSAVPLYPLLAACDAAVVLASTVGLEALLFGLPLGVLEIPGAGYVYDYVESGAAIGLSWNRPMAAQVEQLLTASALDPHSVERYLDRALAVRQNATAEIVGLVRRLVEKL